VVPMPQPPRSHYRLSSPRLAGGPGARGPGMDGSLWEYKPFGILDDQERLVLLLPQGEPAQLSPEQRGPSLADLLLSGGRSGGFGSRVRDGGRRWGMVSGGGMRRPNHSRRRG
jgi:hypothetical protein